jgi:adenosylcobinamide-phosphate synthase
VWVTAFAAPALALLVALALDRWLGAPPLRWHPVGWMGRYLAWIGGQIAPRQAVPSPNWTAFWAGALAWYGGAMLAVLAALLLQRLALQLPTLVAALLLGALLRTMVAWHMPRGEVAEVEAALGQSLDAGRRRLGRIVSREVMQLDEAQVRENALESLAANLHEFVVGPIFWFVLAGLPGVVLYRFARTADAMWGWRGWRAGVHWEWAGKWAARADDVLSWLPARLTALLLAMAAGGFSLGELSREAGRSPSPNSGWPVAALALALRVRLRSANEKAAAPAAHDTHRALVLCARAIAILLGWSALMLAALQWGRAP